MRLGSPAFHAVAGQTHRGVAGVTYLQDIPVFFSGIFSVIFKESTELHITQAMQLSALLQSG